jgi:hypothetical protein
MPRKFFVTSLLLIVVMPPVVAMPMSLNTTVFPGMVSGNPELMMPEPPPKQRVTVLPVAVPVDPALKLMPFWEIAVVGPMPIIVQPVMVPDEPVPPSTIPALW